MRYALGLVFATLLVAAGDPLETLRKEHPRLIALDSDIERLRGLIRANPQARKMYDSFVAEAAALESAPTVQYKIVGPRLLAQSRLCLDRVYLLGLLYRLDGDRKYLERALAELRAAAAFPDWNPSHFLDTAEMSHAFAIGYDWLYKSLSEDDRAWIREALVSKGLRVAQAHYEKGAWWAAVEHNWNQVCNGGIGIGALAVAGDHPDLARDILRRARENLPHALASYAPDGGWAEGPGYWHYATRYTAYFLAALETALGTDFGLSASEGFDRAGHFRVYFCGPSGRTFNYADASDTVGTAAEMFWLARKFSQPVYAWHEQRRLERAEVLDLVWFREEAQSPAEARWPLDAYFRGVDVAFLRSSWDDPDAIFVGVKGGDNKVNHSQLDLGTFVLDAGGTRWAIDLGPDDYNLPQYFGALRWTYYRMRTESHNTVLIDGENQDRSAAAPVVERSFQPKLALVRIDLANAYPDKMERLERAVALADRKTVIVQDRIKARQPVEALWGMVTDAEVSLRERAAELRKPGWVVDAEILSPGNGRFETISTRPPQPQRQNEGTTKLLVRLPEKVEQADIIVSLTPRREGTARPAVKVKLPL
ncbi:MAG: heparinase II/III family protein [Bryobacteraceae bacterium]|nr:heparinase II/III family protein [Bryobacteraceae bacterium]